MQHRAVIVGAGMGGLAAAIELASAGVPVTLLEAQAQVGGKARSVDIAGHKLDMGPSVLTMREVFEELFALGHATLQERVQLAPLDVLTHHRWSDGTQLDLRCDTARNAEEVGRIFGPSAQAGYRAFAEHAAKLYALAAETFIFGPKPSLTSAAWRFGRRVMTAARDMDALRTLDAALHEFFPATPQLRQLFGRYATYVGASPTRAPASLALICEVERQGVASIVGGVSALARAMAQLAHELGAELQLESPVRRIVTERGRVTGAELVSGERISASHVIFNGDVRALEGGVLWAADGSAPAQTERPLAAGFSHVAFGLVAELEPTSLSQHNVLFADASHEFEAIFERHTLPHNPTVYLCAPDRAHAVDGRLVGEERLFCLTNAPTMREPLTPARLEQSQHEVLQRLRACGLPIKTLRASHALTPYDFGQRFYATDGAIYGEPPHGWRHLMGRPSNRTKIAGLFRAGGSVHPGPGVPMATLSGRQAAQALLDDLASPSRWLPRAMRGGISMPKATTAATR